MTYSIDTSSLVAAWLERYPPDVLPPLWEKDLPTLIASGKLRATEEVRFELERKDDDLAAWAKGQGALFVEVDAAIQQHVRDLLSDHPRLVNAHRGSSAADPFVIGLALTTGGTVVTEESMSGSAKRPRIPDVCHARGVRCISLLTMIREQSWRYR